MNKEFYYTDFKQPAQYILLIMLAAFPIAVTFLSNLSLHRNLIFLVYLLFGAMIVTVLVNGLSRKIIITDTGITYKSWRKQVTMDWSLIKSWGLFSLNREKLKELDMNNIKAPGVGGQVYVFFSTKAKHSPEANAALNENYFHFPCHKKLFDLLKDKLTA